MILRKKKNQKFSCYELAPKVVPVNWGPRKPSKEDNSEILKKIYFALPNPTPPPLKSKCIPEFKEVFLPQLLWRNWTELVSSEGQAVVCTPKNFEEKEVNSEKFSECLHNKLAALWRHN